MDLDPKGANSQIKDALDPTLNRAGHEDASSSVAPSAGMAPSSTSITVAPSIDDSPLVNVTQPADVRAEGSSLNQSALVTDDAGPSSMQQSSLHIEVSGDVATARSRNVNNLIESEDIDDVTIPLSGRNDAIERATSEFMDSRVQSNNILNVAVQQEVSSPEDIQRGIRRGNLRPHRQHSGQTANDITVEEDRAEGQATNDFIMERKYGVGFQY